MERGDKEMHHASGQGHWDWPNHIYVTAEAGVENTKQNTTPDPAAIFKERQRESLSKP